MSEVAAVSPSTPTPKRSIPSPCIGICEMIETSGLCAGCARSHEELDRWRDGTDAWRQSVWDVLPQRLSDMGVKVRRLQTTSDDVLDFIENSIRGASGSWVLGVYGGVGEFNREPDEPYDITRTKNEITAVTARGALRFTVGSAARLLAIDGSSQEPEPRAHCLAVHKSMVAIPVEKHLTRLGTDKGAIRPDDHDLPLFDLGLGRARARFCIRTSDPELLAVLEEVEGLPLSEVFARAGTALLKASPTRVIETAMGRVEVETAIPSPGERSPSGPHPHLLPDHLAQRIDSAPGLNIPDAYAVGALFYPRRDPSQ